MRSKAFLISACDASRLTLYASHETNHRSGPRPEIHLITPGLITSSQEPRRLTAFSCFAYDAAGNSRVPATIFSRGIPHVQRPSFASMQRLVLKCIASDENVEVWPPALRRGPNNRKL